MFRYLAFLWDPARPRAAGAAERLALRFRAASRDWDLAVGGRGLAVYCAGVRPGSMAPYLLHDGAGVVLGKLFARAGEGALASGEVILGARETAAIVSTEGRALVEHYWGRYVGFLHDAPGDRTWILRDPSGGLPCFMVASGPVTIVASSAEDWAPLSIPVSINWRYVAAHLASSQPLECTETGLNEVSSVHAGECVALHEGRVTCAFYWHPAEIASNALEDATDAVSTLRSTVRTCVRAWAACYDGVLHRLSGGLDSSIVLSCLHDAPARTRITCVNYYSQGSNTDERRYARLAARQARCELIEEERDATVSLAAMLNASRSARPSVHVYSLHYGRAEARLGQARGASAIFSGEYGDALFYQNPAMLAAADFVHRHGFRPDLFGVALDVANVEGVSIWRVLRQAIVDGRPSKIAWTIGEQVASHRSLMTRAVLDDLGSDDRFINPWLQSVEGLPMGKLRHIHMACVPQLPYDPLGGAGEPEQVPALVSQPIIELCLRLPTYLLVKGGWDRSIARRAFRHDVPREIITRRTKGGVEEHVKDVFRRNLPFVRELLLDGQLVRRGLLDRSRLEAVLAGQPTDTRAPMSELHRYLITEAWLAAWSAADNAAAARRVWA